MIVISTMENKWFWQSISPFQFHFQYFQFLAQFKYSTVFRPNLVLIFFLQNLFMYLRGRERRRQTELPSTCFLPRCLQGPRLGSCQSQQPGAQARSPACQELRYWCHYLPPPRSQCTGSWSQDLEPEVGPRPSLGECGILTTGQDTHFLF